jgi:hypothetical protein
VSVSAAGRELGVGHVDEREGGRDEAVAEGRAAGRRRQLRRGEDPPDDEPRPE